MTKVVNDNYPLSNDELKAKILSEGLVGKTGNTDTASTQPTLNTPTEVIDLPSKGYFYPEGHPLSSGKVEMKYMTAREEDILSSATLIKQGVVIDKLLQSLLVTKFNFNDLLTIDKNAIFIAARILAYGNDYEVEVTCPSCGAKEKKVIDLAEFAEKEIDWSKFAPTQTTHEFTLPLGKQVLTLKFLTQGDDSLIESELKAAKKLSKITGVDPELTTRLKHTIVAVNGDTNKSVINATVDNMLSRDSLALRKHLKEITPDIDTTFGFACSSCGYEQDNMQMPIGVGFFWPGA